MKEDSKTDDLLLKYALGRLSEQEQEQVEQRIFADSEFFGRLQGVEDDLIDVYSNGRLSPDDRGRFEKYLLQSDADRDRVEFSRTLTAVISGQRKKTKSKTPRWLAAATEFMRGRVILVPLAASLILALACVWLVVQTSNLSGKLNALLAEKTGGENHAQQLEQALTLERERTLQLSEELRREQELRETRDQKAPEGLPGLASFILTLGGVRDSGASTRITIPPAARQVRLEAVFKTGPYPRYRAELQKVDGQVVWRRTGLSSRKRGASNVTSLIVPAQTLHEDDYILALVGITSSGHEEMVGEYSFRVLRKTSQK